MWIVTRVLFVPHDAIHHMLNNCTEGGGFEENIAVIDIKDNVFIGSNSTILSDATIGPNTIIAAGSLVNRSVRKGVYAGAPARYICSFDEFVEKRHRLYGMAIEKVEGG